MKKFILALAFAATFHPYIFSQDTLVVHDVKLTSENGVLKMDDVVIPPELFKKIQTEQNNYQTKSLNRICWIKRIDKNHKMFEQGLFCSGNLPIGNVIRYDAKGQIKYKKLYSGGKPTSCMQAEIGRRATEEIYDLVNGLRIYGTWVNGVKDGQFLYYDKAGTIVGVEAFDKGNMLKRKGRIYIVKEDGSFGVRSEGTATANINK